MHPAKRPIPRTTPPVPAGLSTEEEAVFRHLLAAVDPGHFILSDMPLLIGYTQAIAMHDRATKALRREGDVVNGKVNPWVVVLEKSQRAMVALSMRLRLSPQARRERAQLPQPRTWYETRGGTDE
jgi:phage terminase small subunit